MTMSASWFLVPLISEAVKIRGELGGSLLLMLNKEGMSKSIDLVVDVVQHFYREKRKNMCH